MTDTQVSQLRRGDVVHDGIHHPFTVTADARMSKTNTHHEAWAVSPSGALVVRITHHHPEFHLEEVTR